MKIGTDGVLLGAWASLEHQPESILDIGTGTGLIALMLAQRSSAEVIDAIEIDDDAYEQAFENFENSDWNDRLFCYHSGFENFAREMSDDLKYDLIISNPPFYSEDYLTNDPRRDQARFKHSLPFENLLSGVVLLLSPIGKFNVIVPIKEEGNLIRQAEVFNLYPHRITRAKGTPTSEIKRSLIEFGAEKKYGEPQILILENSRHNYTPEFTELARDFYLKI